MTYEEFSMTTRPRLIRSIPFWVLLIGSLASAAAGAFLLLDKLGGMDARLTDGSATSNDVYVGQIWAILGAILVGAGLVGLALALTIGALRTFVASTPRDGDERPASDDAAHEVAESDVDPVAGEVVIAEETVDRDADETVDRDADETVGRAADETVGRAADAYGYDSTLGYAPGEKPAGAPALR